MEFLGISLTEWAGYAASAGVLISFLMKDLRTLRIVNSVGCMFFVIYGLMLNSIPVIITNLAIIGINFYYLFYKRQQATG
ncbi:uroporphyrinogen decarboxylase [Leptobacterium flavescens]|uniref:Uroporphyrinogen decarboxylase n=1 Tax=Leptobacterium flavescens TaxID=472055 RepID=A0A6P0URZ5_9FLAO|nr:YgjV family protein [Leptobacterium flavescens]NER15290.1 uroporphyrinogen decarboxylase [Leptobacterium flavescens]